MSELGGVWDAERKKAHADVWKMVEPLRTFATPASILTFFAATGDGGLVVKFLKSGSAASGATRPWDDCFALKVAQHRDAVAVDSPKLQMLMDMMWWTWSGAFEAEFVQLATCECQSGSSSFLWHCHLKKAVLSLSSASSIKHSYKLAICQRRARQPLARLRKLALEYLKWARVTSAIECKRNYCHCAGSA